MRQLIALILVLLIFSGCTARPAPTTEPPAQGWSPAGDSGNLCSVPVEAENARQLLRTADGLLLVCGDGEELKLTLLAEADLSVLAEADLPATDLAYVQAMEAGVANADPGSSAVTFLTGDLEISRTVSSDAGTKTWLLSTDGGTLFALSQEGVTVHDLTNGGSRQLLSCRTLSVAALSAGQVFLAALGTDDLMTRWYELDLAACALTELSGSRLIAIQEAMLPQTTGEYISFRGTDVTLYDSEGRFRSTCTLSAASSRAGRDFLWSDVHQGWFFLEYTDGAPRLLFWDPAVPTSGEDVGITPEPELAGTILPAELYARAEELSRRFDLDIRIADRCIRDYGSYDSEMLTDPQVAASALDVLEEVLSRYPEGFFTQLKYGNRHSVRIELVDHLSGKEGHDVSSGTSAFTVRRDQYCMIVLNANRIRESVIFHEFSHIIDDRMRWEAQFREDALYSEEGWLALQPEGFAYADSYQSISDSVKAFYDSGYFATNYACVSATEDRAVTMEKACTGEKVLFDANPHLMEKLRYYCACIRDSFDTEGWPETTPWEQFLE